MRDAPVGPITIYKDAKQSDLTFGAEPGANVHDIGPR